MGITCSSQKRKTDLKMILDLHPQQQIIPDQLQQQCQNSQLHECQFHPPCNELSNAYISDLVMKISQKEENQDINQRSPDPDSSQLIQQEVKFKSRQLIKFESSTKNLCDRRILKMIKCHSCGRQIKQKYSMQTLQNIF